MKKFHEYYIEREVISKIKMPAELVKEMTKCMLNKLTYMETKKYLKDLGFDVIKEDWNGVKKGIEDAAEGLTESKKKWIQKAINPQHKGFCTPTTKKTCTPKRKALAMRFKKGDIHKTNLKHKKKKKKD